MDESVSKAFIQAIINHGSVRVDYAISEILKPIADAHEFECPSDDAAFKEFVVMINSKLAEFNQTLSFIQHPLLPDEEFLVFGLTSEALATTNQKPQKTAAESHYFGELLRKIIVESTYGIPWSEVYSVNDLIRKALPKSRMQDLIQLWSKQGYFLEKDDILYFGPRMLTEFANYLKSKYAEFVQDCPLCNKLVLWDVQCNKCEARIHRGCIRKYLIRLSTCPTCAETWETPLTSR